MSVITEKQAMRAEARERRKVLKQSLSEAPRHMMENFLEHVPVMPNATISGYWPTEDEADPRPLLEHLRHHRHAIALPRVAGVARTPLAFHIYPPDSNLVPHKFGHHEPPPDWTNAVPSVVIVPLLAFDAQGYRLGFGAGYYDATLADLRRGHKILAVGYAYSGQEVPSVPHEAHDERLDWIVTEAGAHKLGI